MKYVIAFAVLCFIAVTFFSAVPLQSFTSQRGYTPFKASPTLSPSNNPENSPSPTSQISKSSYHSIQYKLHFSIPLADQVVESSNSVNTGTFITIYKNGDHLQKRASIFAVKDGPTSELGGVDESKEFVTVKDKQWKVVVYHFDKTIFSLFHKASDTDKTLYSISFENVEKLSDLSPEQKAILDSLVVGE
jgi:hypothetical protein